MPDECHGSSACETNVEILHCRGNASEHSGHVFGHSGHEKAACLYNLRKAGSEEVGNSPNSGSEAKNVG